MKRRLTLLSIVLSAAAVAGALAGATRAEPSKNPYRARVGFSSHTTYMSSRDAAAYVARAHALGVRWLREDFSWSMFERRRGHFDWRATDRLMRSAAQASIDVVAVVGYAPPWANGGRSDDKYPPLSARDYARATAAVAHRYGRRGSFWRKHPRLKARPLKAMELWNEAWHAAFWKPEPDVAAYAELVRLAAPAVKAQDKAMKVLVSADLQMGYSDGRDYTGGTRRNWEHGFLAQLVTRDYAYASIDGYAVHPYSQRFGPYETHIPGFSDEQAQQWLYAKLVVIRDALARADRLKPLWSTELGWSTNGDVDESTQADYLHGALRRAVEEWGGFIARSFVYVLEKPHNGDYAGGYALLHDNLSPKPAWLKLKELLAG